YNKGNNIAGISEYYDNKYNLAVGTGWRIEIYTADDKLVETIYLSVLGDITGDGKINSTDITYLKQISTKEIDFTSLSLEQQLASMIDNRGMISVVDVQILKAYTNYEVDIKLYF
ncbi:MAG: hypothetical protein K2P12_00975, partial [Clostridia bacterium]|nr:hypothetical protein [Clostridia bacterium]